MQSRTNAGSSSPMQGEGGADACQAFLSGIGQWIQRMPCSLAEEELAVRVRCQDFIAPYSSCPHRDLFYLCTSVLSVTTVSLRRVPAVKLCDFRYHRKATEIVGRITQGPQTGRYQSKFSNFPRKCTKPHTAKHLINPLARRLFPHASSW